jgi:hypothetical protein
VKNDAKGHEIMNDWIKQYNSDKWWYDGKWRTESAWAGDDYEQGAFLKILKNHKQHVDHLDYYYLNNNNPNNINNTITMHLAGIFKLDPDRRKKSMGVSSRNMVPLFIVAILFTIVFVFFLTTLLRNGKLLFRNTL